MTWAGSIRPLRISGLRAAVETMPTTRPVSASVTAAPLKPGTRGWPWAAQASSWTHSPAINWSAVARYSASVPSSYRFGNPYARSLRGGSPYASEGAANSAGFMGTGWSSSSTARSPGSVSRPSQPPCAITRAGIWPSVPCAKETVTGAVRLHATTWAQVRTCRSVTRKPAPVSRPQLILACQEALVMTAGRSPRSRRPARVTRRAGAADALRPRSWRSTRPPPR